MHTLVLDHDAIAEVIARVGVDALMDQTIDRLEKALPAPPDPADLPARRGFGLPDPARPGVIEWMPFRDPADSVTVKIVSYVPANPGARRAPTILATIAGFDLLDGRLRTLCDGVLATALRTGAASAVASRVLAIPDAAVLGVIGAGAQAVTQVHALSRVRPLTTCLVHDCDARAARSLADRCPVPGLRFAVTPLPELLEAADIICTATSVEPGAGPVFPDTGLRPHVHVNAVGSDLPGKTELPVTLLRRALVVPDLPEQARREGELQQLGDVPVPVDLPGLVARADRFTHHRPGPTVFDSTGTALEDHVVLAVLTEAAEICGLMPHHRLQARPSDALNPYSIERP